MITQNGEEIPDTPTDPEERKRWKIIYYSKLYGASKETIKKILEDKYDPNSRDTGSSL